MNNDERILSEDESYRELSVYHKKQRLAIILSLVVLFFCCTIGFNYFFRVKNLLDVTSCISSTERDPSGFSAAYTLKLSSIENSADYDLKFSSRGCIVEAVSGNRILYSYGAAQSIDRRYIGRVYSTIPLSEIGPDSEVVIHLTRSDLGAEPVLYKTELCPHSESYRYYLTNGSSSFPLALFSFSLVFLVLLFTVIGKKRSMVFAGVYLSGALTCFSFILLDGSGHYLIFTSNTDLWNFVFWLSAYLFPFFVIMFFRESEKSSHHKTVLLILAAVNLIFFITATFLGIKNVMPLYYLTKKYHFLLVIDGLLGLFLIFENYRKKQSIINLRALMVTTLIWVVMELINFSYPKILTVTLALPIFDYRSISAILVFYAFCLAYSEMSYQASIKSWMQHQQINRLEEREQQLTPYQEIAQAFFDNFEGIYYIEKDTSSFVCYYQSEDYQKLEIDKFGDDFFEASLRNCREVVYEEDVDYVSRMISREAVLEGIQDGKRYSYIFRVMLNERPTYFQVNAQMEQSGKHILIGVRNINEIMKQEEALQNASRQLHEAKEELRLSRIKNFNSQMQPHFLYNVLSSIQEIIFDDPEYASRLIGSFTVHLRGTIRAMSSDNPIRFSEELKNIQAYVEIEKMRLTDRLHVNYDIQATDFMVAPLSIQPLVENAVKHGIYKKGEAGGTLCLRSYETDTDWMIQVLDDGIGFDYEKVLAEAENGKRDSTGLINLKFRLEKLMGANLQIQSQPGAGTEVTVTIPKNKGERPCGQ